VGHPVAQRERALDGAANPPLLDDGQDAGLHERCDVPVQRRLRHIGQCSPQLRRREAASAELLDDPQAHRVHHDVRDRGFVHSPLSGGDCYQRDNVLLVRTILSNEVRR
jgi:hypothetical protein